MYKRKMKVSFELKIHPGIVIMTSRVTPWHANEKGNREILPKSESSVPSLLVRGGQPER